jgi:ribosomal protein S18 acetylase RimI-like enzyme
MTGITLREVVLPDDAPQLADLDTSFTTDVVYAVARDVDGFRLDPVRVEPPVTKRFHIDDVPRAWDCGVVAVADGAVRGFVATGFEPWNARLVIWHFYVDPAWRRRGIGRALIEKALDEGAACGATTAWLETSSLNYPGVQVYERLGFELCGLDTTLYRGTRSDGETALFLARDIARIDYVVPDTLPGVG